MGQHTIVFLSKTKPAKQRRLTFKGKISKQSRIFRSFLTLGQLGEDQEPFPSAAFLSWAKTLNAHSEGIQVAPGDTPRADGADCMYPPPYQQGERDNDTNSIDPACDFEGDRGFDLSSPS